MTKPEYLISIMCFPWCFMSQPRNWRFCRTTFLRVFEASVAFKILGRNWDFLQKSHRCILCHCNRPVLLRFIAIISPLFLPCLHIYIFQNLLIDLHACSSKTVIWLSVSLLLLSVLTSYWTVLPVREPVSSARRHTISLLLGTGFVVILPLLI